jgi:hypothetical protein
LTDFYAFAKSCHRTCYREFRELLLMVDPTEGFRPVFPNSTPSPEEKTKVLKAIVPGRWVAMDTAVIEQEAKRVVYSVPASPLVLPMRKDGWRSCPEIVSFDLPMNESDDLAMKCQQANGPLDLNLQKSKRFFQDIAFLSARLTIPRMNEAWLLLDGSTMDETREDVACTTCAPPRPQVGWSLIQKGNKRYEYGIYAPSYLVMPTTHSWKL